MIHDEYVPEKKKQKNLFGFLQKSNNNEKHHHHQTHHNKKETVITQGIFGVPLKAASVCGSCTDIGLIIPDPVHSCFEEIRKRGLFTEGIFRLSGGAAEIEQLISSFDTPPTYGRYLDLSHYDIHAITCVVKKYLRQLPEPAIPLQYHEKFMQLYDEGLQIDLTTKTLGCLLQQLPKEHFHLIYYIILLCSDILKHADKNMMNSEALAVVFAPVCTGFEQQLKGSSSSMSAPSSWLNKRRHSPTPMSKTSSTSSSSTKTTTTTTSSSSLGAAKLLMINYNNETMSQCMEINAKWTRIWALMIEYNDRLLQLWKETPLYDYYPLNSSYSSNIVYNSGCNNGGATAPIYTSSSTMPCLSSPTQLQYQMTPPSPTTTAKMNHSLVGLHPASVVTMTSSMMERGGDISPPAADDLLLDIAPALVLNGGKKSTKKRHSMNSSHQHHSDDDLYKVVVMRRPRQNSCSRAIFNLDNSAGDYNHSPSVNDKTTLYMDNNGLIHEQQHGPPPPVPPHTRTSSIANILRNSKRSLSRATGATAATAVTMATTAPTIIVQPQ